MEEYYNAIDLLKGMIRIPSFSKEEEKVADYLELRWKEAGHRVRRIGNNLLCGSEQPDNNKPTILLNSHIDTVKPTSGWERDPFLADDTDGNRLFGLGSNDAGASVVSLYAAYTYLTTKAQPYNLLFLASCEEEISGEKGISQVLPSLPPISFAIVGEPTGMHPAVAEKGLMVLDCLTKGKSGHAARNEGINAITLALKDIEWFNRYIFPESSDFLGSVKMTVTIINAGTQHNVIPDCCRFTVDVRTNEFYTNEQLLGLIKEQVNCEVTARSVRLNSSSIDASHPFVRRAVLMDREPFGSVTLSDQALMPFPSVKIGPGDSARSHTADEYIRLDEIREGIDMYIRMLDGLEI